MVHLQCVCTCTETRQAGVSETLTIVKFDVMSAGLTIQVGGIVALARRKRSEDWAESWSDSEGGRCLACSCDSGL